MPSPPPSTEEVCRLPNGCTLYRRRTEAGGWLYLSDEVGGGVVVWDTSLVAVGTLLAALVEEERRAIREIHEERREFHRKGT